MFTRSLRVLAGFITTILLWAYYFLSFVLFFSPFYMASAIFSKDRERAFQNLNCIFDRCFFLYMKLLMPSVSIHIAPEVYAIRSSVIIANHLSFLDPILLLSIFKQHKTIVKSMYFKVPIFGWIIKTAGYISPSLVQEEDFPYLMDQVKSMRTYFAAGGNLLIFPEGTRSRSGLVGHLQKGAFTIAKLCQTTIQVLRIDNTNKLYPPGRFLFNAGTPVDISVKLVGCITFENRNKSTSIAKAIQKAGELLGG